MTLLRKKYDHVCSLWQWCTVAIDLRKLGLRSHSGPFDWLGPYVPVTQYLDMTANGVQGLMLKENLRAVGSNEAEGTIYYRDLVNGFESRHEFRIGVSFDENYANYRALLDRRIAWLISTLRSGVKILFVHWHGGEDRYRRGEVVDAVKRIRAAYPESNIDLMVIETEKFAKDVSYEEPEPGVVFAIGDFYDTARFGWVMGNEKLVLSVLQKIRVRGRWRTLLRLKLTSISRRLKHGMSRMCLWKSRQFP